MGDLPLYVGDDSADVYEYRKCFQLDDKFYPKFVSGASPDYFSKDGQLWGHPLYDWDYLKKTRYNFWIKRLKWNNEIFDILNDMLLGKITIYQKEILIEKLKLVEKFLNM